MQIYLRYYFSLLRLQKLKVDEAFCGKAVGNQHSHPLQVGMQIGTAFMEREKWGK